MLKDGEKGVIIQRDKETYAVAPHVPCGVISPDTLRKMADVAEKYNAAALKITSAARIAIVGLKEEDVDNVWADLGMSPGAAVGLCVRSIKACPGTTFCKRGQEDSLGMGMKLDEIYHGMELPGKLKMGVSGCANQCAETSVKDIGLVGGPKGWKIFVGGCAGNRPRLGSELVTAKFAGLPVAQTPVVVGPVAGGEWTVAELMSTARNRATASVVDGKIYVIGGYNDKKQPVNVVEVYDPVTNRPFDYFFQETKAVLAAPTGPRDARGAKDIWFELELK